MSRPRHEGPDVRAALLAVVGFALIADSAIAWLVARAHMAELGDICGRNVPHCAWCGVAVVLGLLGAATLAAVPAMLRRNGRREFARQRK